MKKQIVCLFAAAALLGVGCDDKIPEVGTMDVPATGIVLDEDLRGGVLLEVGQTLDVAWRVTVEPADATDLAEMFYSSNVEVATVSPKGLVTAHKSGITMISIYVAGFEAYFPVRVVDQVPVDIESLAFAEPTMECYAGVGYTLYVSTQPLDQNEGVIFSSSDPSVATVDAETGRMKCLAVGEATITAVAKNHPEISATMTVTVTEFYGDWDRSGWRMSFSHGYKADTAIGSSETAAIDDNEDTTLAMNRPGRVSSIPATDEIWFQIDRGNDDPGLVDYLRVRHRPRGNNNENILVRWFGFNRIEGSRDGEHFEVLAERVALTPDPNVYDNLLTDNIAIPENDYRYLRFIGWNDVSTVSPYLGFYCARGKAYGGTDPGTTIQINEFYLGRTEK